MKNIKRYAKLLTLLNVILSLSALIYDLPAIKNIPLIYWPFIVICPIYPALLAVCWHKITRVQKINPLLIAFATIPSIIYFVGAALFYPLWMAHNGFNIYALGQVFWVALYGLQAIYLYFILRVNYRATLMVISFLATSFLIQHKTKTYGYLDLTNMPENQIISIYLILIIIAVAISVKNRR